MPFRRFDEAKAGYNVSAFEWIAVVVALAMLIFMLYQIVRILAYG